MKVTIGGDRLGSGKKMKVELQHYERSTHNLSKTVRTTLSAGTLIPILVQVAQPGDTWDIDLDAYINTHPTIGPLFGTFKAQFDAFEGPIRLYQGQLHNNKLGIGMNMAQVKLPILSLTAPNVNPTTLRNINNSQINPSCVLAYLGIRGIGLNAVAAGEPQARTFNAIALLMLWDTYKNYYANKQEEIGAVIHTTATAIEDDIDEVRIGVNVLSATSATPSNWSLTLGTQITIDTSSTPDLTKLIIWTNKGPIPASDLGPVLSQSSATTVITYNFVKWGIRIAQYWNYANPNDQYTTAINVETFPLADIDTMRERILAHAVFATPFNVTAQNDLAPYNMLFQGDLNFYSRMYSQEGLPVKTYQSDLFNNWISTEWIDGPGGINEITAVDTSSGSFEMEALIMAKKVYIMLNQIAISGGSYQDWLDAVFDHPTYWKAESPIYHGGLSKEVVFQEVVSTAEADATQEGAQPLGTLGGKGTFSQKHKGGRITIKVNEPSYIMILASLTPRIDYSQGNAWDVHLQTMDDLHKPAMDQIGYQELITEQMCFWDTHWDGTKWVTKSAGKQPAWLNYMTNINTTYGNFAIEENEMFMTLNRRYEAELTSTTATIKDLTTYIDPAKYNNIFAQTSLDSQNFWLQIGIDITLRRKISAKVIPNL